MDAEHEAEREFTVDERRYWCCNAIGCDNIASIVVDASPGSGAAYCGLHWDELRPAFSIDALYVPGRPVCFQAACETPAVCVRTHLDGTLLPVCELHLDDLSWISPTQSELLELKRR